MLQCYNRTTNRNMAKTRVGHQLIRTQEDPVSVSPCEMMNRH